VTLHASPVRWFSQDFRVSADGREICTLDLAAMRSRGQFDVEGERYEIAARGIVPQRYRLERDGRVLAEVSRDGVLSRAYTIRAEDRSLTLRGTLMRRRFDVLHGDLHIGAIRPVRLAGRSAIAEFTAPLPLHLQVFLVAVTLLIWRKRARAASSSG
jgi:hypothetical protein